jgi:subtilisin family serine protease
MAYQLGSGAGGTNVTAAWNLGITGAGIQVTVIDDGLQYSHPELRCRYNASHSYNAQTNSADPDPFVGAFAGQAAPYAGDNSHGTFCAASRLVRRIVTVPLAWHTMPLFREFGISARTV